MAKRSKRREPVQGALPFRPGRGGARRGAGRKPKGMVAGVSHLQREQLSGRVPVHVTMKLRGGLPKLRQREEYQALRGAFAAGCDKGVRGGGRFRLCHYAVLNDHLHFVVEAEDRDTLARGLQGLLIRIARALNKLWGRKGKVFADRYHSRSLKTPKEVRHALRYVLGNGKKHAAEGRHVTVSQAIDTFTSAPWFDGFAETFTVRGIETVVRPITDAKTWMLTLGWKRHGLLSVHELPATA